MLGIVVIVYVLAVTLVGKAVKITIDDIYALEEKNKTEVNEAKQNIRTLLDNTEQNGISQEQLTKLNYNLKNLQQ